MTQVTNIQIPHGCRPATACSRDDTRPNLRHGWLKRRGDDMWLFATDSYIAVALKVTGDNLAEGIVPYRALCAIERRRPVSQVSPTAWSVAGGAFTHTTYDTGFRVDYDRAPDFDGKVADGALFSDEEGITGPFMVAHPTMKRLGRALGGQCLHVVAGGGLSPLRVLANNNPDCRGLIMPVRVSEYTKPEAGR